MFEFLTGNSTNAISVLKQDHSDLKELFDKFDKTEDPAEKVKIAYDALQILKIHDAIEEEIFYPALAGKIDSDILDEADEEHHVAKVLMAELDQLGPTSDRFAAKFTVLAEAVRHHIKEEEHILMPQAEDSKVDMAELGKELLARKQELNLTGAIPPTAEEKMVSAGARLAMRRAARADQHLPRQAPQDKSSHSSVH